MTDKMDDKANSSSELFYDIMRNLSEGVITVSPKGVITYINPAGRAILDLKEDILGKKFSECFLEQPGNSGFVDSFMDAVYARAEGRESIVSYRGGKGELLLYQVLEIGEPYNVKGRCEVYEPKPLKEPIPVCFSGYQGEVQIEPLQFPIRLGELLIEGIQGNHPGGSVIMRLRYQGRSIVYATDYEHEEGSFARLKDFSQNADLILYDGQYEPEEYERKKGFGHSTAQMGIRLLEESGASFMLLVHHDPLSTDEELRKREEGLGRSDIRYARQGETVELR
ncbi:MAG: hypothetical protein K6F35_06580 [Lachnospiraceae bacterium]|nr:hypothetical protein [Lachnospiraceae bacterium]